MASEVEIFFKDIKVPDNFQSAKKSMVEFVEQRGSEGRKLALVTVSGHDSCHGRPLIIVCSLHAADRTSPIYRFRLCTVVGHLHYIVKQ
jgi:hypothetical protein